LGLAGHPEVFVIGDLAAAKDEQGKMLPGVAPVAIQEGKFVAKLIRKEVESLGSMRNQEGAPSLSRTVRQGGNFDSRRAFHYWDKGSLATIGRAAAVAQFGKIHISGFIAWLSWLFVHILFLIGFRNRLLVFIQWAWSYVTYERGARLITGSTYLPGWTAPNRATTVTPGQQVAQEIHSGTPK
jgi:NADH dehydrogenase